jgi:nucleoside-diphosphate-sugar epimerase
LFQVKARRVALILGSSSMLGTSLAQFLNETGVGVLTSSRTAGDVPYDLASLQEAPYGASFEALFVCAAEFADDSMAGCLANIRVNATAMVPVARWAAAAGCTNVIHASSISAYEPDTSYGLSKALGEQIWQWAGKTLDITATSIRLPQLCDDQGRCTAHQPWFSRIVASAAQGLDLRLAPNDHPRNFLHVHDAAHALVSAWQHPAAGVRTVLSANSHTYREIADMAYGVFGRGGSVIDDPLMRPFRNGSRAVLADPSAQTPDWPVMSMQQTLERIKALGTAHAYTL